jgi:hypothetical protein
VLSWQVRRRGGGVLVVLLVPLALLASMAAGPPRRPGPCEPPPPCRLVPSRAGAWSDATCLRAPARHQARRHRAHTEDH